MLISSSPYLATLKVLNCGTLSSWVLVFGFRAINSSKASSEITSLGLTSAANALDSLQLLRSFRSWELGGEGLSLGKIWLRSI